MGRVHPSRLGQVSRYVPSQGVKLISDGQPILATGSSNGSIASWDLSKGGRLLHVNREAHEQGVTGLEFVPGQQLLISSSGDNSVKVS
jgi:U3 small nucleolar RNA-associated protein 21